MGLFDNLFGKKPQPPSFKPAPITAQSPLPPIPSSPRDAEIIKAFDAYGREIQVTRKDWRTKILPGQFQQHWNNPDALATFITQSLQDDFAAETLPAARQLERIDTNPRRGVTLLGVTLLQLKNFEEANVRLTLAAAKFSGDGVILTNLAKACSGLGQQARADMILWKALEADPNLDNGLLWYVAQQKERDGDQGELDALLRVAALPGSWRPQLWLARRALQKDNNLSTAMAYYHQALERLAKIPADVLMQISGDLGNAGHLMELLELVGPRFDVTEHGLTVGNNLIKAYVDTGQAELARKILTQLYAQQRPDWKQMLVYWDTEIDKIDKNYGPIEGSQIPEISMLLLEGPLWAREGTPFSEMLPTKDADAVTVTFLCGSAEMEPQKAPTQITSQPTNAEGRFTRALPIYLAEQIHIHTDARASLLVPWMKQGGFVVAGGPWDPARTGGAAGNAQFVVTLHLVAKAESWKAQFQLLRMIDHSSMAAWEESFDPNASAGAIQRMVAMTVSQIHAHANSKSLPTSEWFFPPSERSLPSYAVGLEQALAVSCSRMTDKPFLSAERSIFENHLSLCVDEPNNICCRFLLLSTLEKEAARQPAIVAEFRKRIELLQREKPLVEPAQALASAAVSRIFPA